MSLKPSPARPKRRPFEDASESDGELSSNEMPDLLLPESQRGDPKVDKDGFTIYEADDVRRISCPVGPAHSRQVLCKDDENGYLVKWKGYYLGE
jgi:hypothetical protein